MAKKQPIRWTLAEIRRRQKRGVPLPAKVRALLRAVRERLRDAFPAPGSLADGTLTQVAEYFPDHDAAEFQALVRTLLDTGGRIHDPKKQRKGGRQPRREHLMSRTWVEREHAEHPEISFLDLTAMIATRLKKLHHNVDVRYVRRACASLKW